MAVTLLAGGKFKNLPKNDRWERLAAPSERWEALQEKTREMKRDTLLLMEKTGRGTTDTIESVRNDFHDLQQSLEESLPAYPSPREHFAKMREDAVRHGRIPFEYTVEYYPGDFGREPLVRYTRVVAKSLDDYSSSDLMRNRILDLMEGFKQAERRVISSLKEPGPASQQKEGILKRRQVSDIVEELFSEQQSKLAYIAVQAANVRDQGITVKLTY